MGHSTRQQTTTGRGPTSKLKSPTRSLSLSRNAPSLSNMYKYAAAIVLCSLFACAAAKPGIVAAAPFAVPAPVITATSNQVVARTFNGIAAAPLLAAPAPLAPVATPFAVPFAGRLAASRLVAAPLAGRYASAYAAPVLGRYAAYAAPAPYAALPYPSAYPSAYAAPLTYAPSFAASLRYSVL